MKTTVRFEGGKELHAALKELSSTATQKNVVVRALKPAAEAIAATARALAPVDEGRLREAIEVETRQPRPKRKKNHFSVAVWVRESEDYKKLKTPVRYKRSSMRHRFREYAIGTIPYVYSRFLEFGTRHLAARPFMRPAWDLEGGAKAIERIRVAMRVEIDKAAARAARKALKAASK